MLNIAFVGINYGPEPTGIAPYTQQMAEELRSRGHNVAVVTSYPSYPAWRVDSNYRGLRMAEVIEGVEVTRLRSFVPASPTLASRAIMELVFGLRAASSGLSSYDVVVCISPALFSTGIVLSRLAISRRGVKRVVWVQDLYSAGLEEIGHTSRAVYLLRHIEKRAMRLADTVISIHDEFARSISERFKVDRDRIKVIKNWSHIGAPCGDGLAARKKFDWAGQETVVLHAGNMGVKQGLESVIRAAELCRQESLPIKFVLMGDGNQRPTLEKLAGSLTQIDIIDPVPKSQLAEVLQAADILLLNELDSISEMCVPSKLTTYFAAGKPVLAATSAGSLSAAEIEESGAGVIVAPQDPTALVEGVIAIREDVKLKEILSDNGKRYSENRMKAQSAFNDFEQCLLNLVCDDSPTERA